MGIYTINNSSDHDTIQIQEMIITHKKKQKNTKKYIYNIKNKHKLII